MPGFGSRAGSEIPAVSKRDRRGYEPAEGRHLRQLRHAARAAMEGGASGIAAINTVKSITNVNLDTYATAPAVRGRSSVGGYSGAAVKPIASIPQEQQTIDVHDQPASVLIGGRHDLAAIPRIVPVLTAMTALVLADALLLQERMAVLPVPDGVDWF